MPASPRRTLHAAAALLWSATLNSDLRPALRLLVAALPRVLRGVRADEGRARSGDGATACSRERALARLRPEGLPIRAGPAITGASFYYPARRPGCGR